MQQSNSDRLPFKLGNQWIFARLSNSCLQTQQRSRFHNILRRPSKCHLWCYWTYIPSHADWLELSAIVNVFSLIDNVPDLRWLYSARAN